MSAEVVKAYFDRHGDDYGVEAISLAAQCAMCNVQCAMRGARL